MATRYSLGCEALAFYNNPLAQFLTGQTQFVPANIAGNDLRLFPNDNKSVVIHIPFPVWIVKFAGDGRSLYTSLPISQRTKTEQALMKIDFNPIRATAVTGTQGFIIKDFAVTPDGTKIVIAGRHREGTLEKCGLFEITVATGVARNVLADDCNYRWSWTVLAVSPAGDRAVASYGNAHTDHNYRLDLIDFAQGTTKSLVDFLGPTWSPDGRWIAAIESNRQRLVLLDASDFSHRRDLGSTIETASSPDSQYLLLWRSHFLKCGFAVDVDPPASFEVVKIASGKRSPIPSSQCQLVGGPIGWMASDIRE